MPDSSHSTADLDRDVALRRQRVERDLEELQARLSPGQLLDEAVIYLRRSRGVEFFHNLGGSVRDRPLPVALVGIGLAWLAASGAGPAGGSRAPDNAEPGLMDRAWEAGRAVARQAGETEAEYRDRVLQARSQVLGLARQAGEAADAFRDRVEEAMYTARERAHELRDRVTETTKSASRAAGALGRNTADLVTTVSDNPILLGALGIVAGAVLGAILPRSGVEEEMLGEIGDRTISAARGMADAAIERGERAARAAAKAGWEATKEGSSETPHDENA